MVHRGTISIGDHSGLISMVQSGFRSMVHSGFRSMMKKGNQNHIYQGVTILK